MLEPVEIESADQARAGFGALETAKGALPLTALDVRARLVGLVSQVHVRQTFHNALAEPIEATYVFPLPERSAVSSFKLFVAGREIEAQLKERGEAREEYERARRAGHRAAIAEEDRSGVFNLRVGNLPAGEEAVVELELVGVLDCCDGEASFRFPLVVAPRYVPGISLLCGQTGPGTASDTDQVPDASRISPPVLLPGFPNPVRLSLEVEIDPAGLGRAEVENLRSSLHSMVVEAGPPVRISLQPGERLDRDFLLRFSLPSDVVQSSLAASAPEAGKAGVFCLTLVPPTTGTPPSQRRRVVFLLDRSGSMQGWKMVAARRALGRMIDTLSDEDSFCVLAFGSHVEASPGANRGLLPAVNRHRWQTVEWLSKVEAHGGTEMGPALAEAIRRLSDDAVGSPTIVLVTDGQVAGEDVFLRTLAGSGKPPRVHAIGIDQAVNMGFLRRLADLGRGICEQVESEVRLDEVMDRVHRALGQPILTQLRMKASAGAVIDRMVPERMADVFPGRPIYICGRYSAGEEPLVVRFDASDSWGRPWRSELASRPADMRTLLSLWGRRRVRELEDRYASCRGTPPAGLEAEIVAVSLESHVLSRFTAYVAVDRAEVVNRGGEARTIVQPVEMPAGWNLAGVMAGCAAPACGVTLEALAAPESLLDQVARSSSPLSAAMDAVMAFKKSLRSRFSPMQTPGLEEARAPGSKGSPPVQDDRLAALWKSVDEWAARPLAGTLDDQIAALLGLKRALEDLLAYLQPSASSDTEVATIKTAIDRLDFVVDGLRRGIPTNLSTGTLEAMREEALLPLASLRAATMSHREKTRFWA
jgi:Ca-activated chloride channel family protein